jgi:hypothetical protein
MKTRPFEDAAVKAKFAAYRAKVRSSLLALRTLIYETAAETAGVGTIVETLKWNQPAYLTMRPQSGSTIRIDATADGFAMYFHCQTSLVETFRRLYPDALVFEGNRALRFREGEAIPVAALKHCIALALTYHLPPQRLTARS